MKIIFENKSVKECLGEVGAFVRELKKEDIIITGSSNVSLPKSITNETREKHWRRDEYKYVPKPYAKSIIRGVNRKHWKMKYGRSNWTKEDDEIIMKYTARKAIPMLSRKRTEIAINSRRAILRKREISK